MKCADSIYFQYLMLEYERIRAKYRKPIEKSSVSATIKTDGGTGSGNHNHQGRPGKIGGSTSKRNMLAEITASAGRLETKSERKAFDKKIQTAILEGKIDTKIDKSKQSKHIAGSVAFEKRKAEGKPNSELTISVEKAQKLVSRYAGTGKIEHVGGYPKRIVEQIYGDTVVGYAVDTNGKSVMTKNFKIHYSGTGTHIVPMKGASTNET